MVLGSQNIYGLGDDQKVYTWDYNKIDWYIYGPQAKN